MAVIINSAPVAQIHGALALRDKVYFRILYGKQIAQKKPDRSHQQVSKRQEECRRLFVQRYAQKRHRGP